MMGMFGGTPGASPAPAAETPRSGGLSSQDMMSMFGGTPGAGPTAMPETASGGLSSQDMMSMFGGTTSTDSSHYAPAPLDNMNPPPTMPPGAPGTPGGAEWRGFSELEEPDTHFNWDDPGLGLGSAANAPVGEDRGGFSWSDVEGTPAATASPVYAGDAYSMDNRPYEDAGGAILPAEPPAPAPRQGTFSGGIVMAGIALIVVLLAIGLLLGAVPALQKARLLPPPQATGPGAAVTNFLTRHLAGDYPGAAGFLDAALRPDYTQTQGLPGLPQTVDPKALRVVPLAADATNAEVYAFFAPVGTPGSPPVTFLLRRSGDNWLITGVAPPPATP
jgi:hypothetical protein